MYRWTNWNAPPNESTDQTDDIRPSAGAVDWIALLAGRTVYPRIDLSCCYFRQSTTEFVRFVVNVDRVAVVVMMTMTKDQMMRLN